MTVTPQPGRRAAGGYAKARTNTAPRGASKAPSEFADDPFIKRLADPASGERRKRSIKDIQHGLGVLAEQRERAEHADAMYDGDVGMVFASAQVRRLLVRNGVDEDEIRDFNYARIPVDTVANRLQIAAVKAVAEETDDDTADDEGAEPDDRTKAAQAKLTRRAERAIKKLRKVNQLDAEEKSLHKTASKHGEAFLFLWPVEDARGRVVSVDMRVNTSHNVAFIYDPEDPLKISYVIKSWDVEVGGGDDGQGAKTAVRANLYYPGAVGPASVVDSGRRAATEGPDGGDDDGRGMTSPAAPAAPARARGAAGHVERWMTNPGESVDKADAWHRVYNDDAEGDDLDVDPDDLDEAAADEFGDADEPLEKGDIPAPWGLTWFHFRNDRPRGYPEHINAYGPQVLINKLIFAHAATIDYQSFPQRYLLGDPKVDDPLMNVVDPDRPEDDEDDPESEGGTSGLKADPAVVWKLWGKSVGEFQASDPDQFLKPLDRYIKAMAELTDTPQHAFSKASGDMPSGEAVRGLDGPMLAKIQDRQTRYDPAWQDAYELALLMLDITGVEVDVRWVPAAPVNDLNGLQVLQAKRDLGVPGEVVLNEMGYPDDQIDEWLADSKGDDLGQRLDMLVKVGTAVQALAPGVTAGVVDEPATKAFVSRMIRLLAEGTADPETTGPNALPAASFREPPPTNPAMAAVEAGKEDPLKQAQVAATHATAETSRASAEMMRSGGGGLPARKAGPGKAAPRKAAPRKATGRKATASTTAQAQAARG